MSIQRLSEKEETLKSLKTSLEKNLKANSEILKDIESHKAWLIKTIPPFQYLDYLIKTETENKGKSIMVSSTLDPKIEKEIRKYITEWENHTNQITRLNQSRGPIARQIGSLKTSIKNAETEIQRMKVEMVTELRQFLERRINDYGGLESLEREYGKPEGSG